MSKNKTYLHNLFKSLSFKLKMTKPAHIGVIIDGNRRWAKKLLLQPWKGHEKGAETVENTIIWASELGVKMLTFYALSIENLKRDKTEIDYLFDLFRKWFKKIKEDKRIKEKQVKFRFIGNLSLLPKDLQEICSKLEKSTKEHNKFIVNFCVAYGGRQEIIESLKKLVKSKEKITEENFQKNLWLKEEPELIIRTGNRIRTSNFLPWQAAYSEWIFLEKLWPDFTKKDLQECMDKFETVQRNFGK